MLHCIATVLLQSRVRKPANVNIYYAPVADDELLVYNVTDTRICKTVLLYIHGMGAPKVATCLFC